MYYAWGEGWNKIYDDIKKSWALLKYLLFTVGVIFLRQKERETELASERNLSSFLCCKGLPFPTCDFIFKYFLSFFSSCQAICISGSSLSSERRQNRRLYSSRIYSLFLQRKAGREISHFL
jgi:hypothetical protein